MTSSVGNNWNLHTKGVNLINNMQSTLTALIEAASVLGVFMMGAL